MKRFASHFLYLSPDIMYKKYIVEIEDDQLVRFYPLKGEIESTIWLSGSIVVSDKPSYFYSVEKDSTFREMILNLTIDLSENKVGKKYAYYLPALDLNQTIGDSLLLPELLTESFVL